MPFHHPDAVSTACFLAIVLGVLLAIVWGSRVAAHAAGEDAARATRSVALTVTVWVILTSIPPASGQLQASPFPALPLFFVTVLGGSVAFAFSRHGTRLARHLPLSALVGFHLFRLPLELVLHEWASQRSIPSTMTWNGQNFDIVTGIIALLLIPFVNSHPRLVHLFNWLGVALLANVLRVVVMSSPLPFAWDVHPPLVLAAFAPYHLIGTVLVASAVAGHLLLFRRLSLIDIKHRELRQQAPG